MNAKHLIQNKIKGLIESHFFTPVKYDEEGNAYLLEGSEDKVKSHKVFVNEISSGFSPDPNNKREYALYKSSWTFIVKINFKASEVTIESLERVFSEVPSIKVADKKYFILIQSITATHPPQSDSIQGTSVALTLNIKDRL